MRRIVNAQKLWIVLILLCVQAQYAVAQQKPVSIEWRVAEDQVEAVKKAVPLKEVKVHDTRNPVLIGAIVLIGAAALPQLAQSILDVYYRYTAGGAILDLTKEPLLISTSKQIAPGYLLVISKGGPPQLIEVGGGTPLKVEGLLPIIIKALKG